MMDLKESLSWTHYCEEDVKRYLRDEKNGMVFVYSIEDYFESFDFRGYEEDEFVEIKQAVYDAVSRLGKPPYYWHVDIHDGLELVENDKGERALIERFH